MKVRATGPIAFLNFAIGGLSMMYTLSIMFAQGLFHPSILLLVASVVFSARAAMTGIELNDGYLLVRSIFRTIAIATPVQGVVSMTRM